MLLGDSSCPLLYNNDSSINKININSETNLDKSRYIYIYIDEEELKNYNCVKEGKAILINTSLSKGGRASLDVNSLNKSLLNSTVIIMNYYYFNVSFHSKNIQDFNSMTFELISAHGKSSINNWDNKLEYFMGQSMFLNDKRDALVHNRDFLESHPIPPPIFYNLNDMNEIINDNYSLIDIGTNYENIFKGNELIDNNIRSIRYFSDKLWMTMREDISDRISASLSSNKHNNDGIEINDVPVVLFENQINLGIDGIVFTHDTQKGNDIYTKDMFVPYSKHILKLHASQTNTSTSNKYNKIEGDILSFMSDFDEIMNNIEKKHGSIRVNYIPKFQGAKAQIIFKDYFKDNKNVKMELDYDNHFNTTEYIDEYINDIFQ